MKSRKKKYIKPTIAEKKTHVNFFLRGNHWLDDIEGLLFQEVYAYTVYLPYISNNPPPEPEPDPGGGGS